MSDVDELCELSAGDEYGLVRIFFLCTTAL